jgi:endonuclease YncB( thermonuclease family)
MRKYQNPNIIALSGVLLIISCGLFAKKDIALLPPDARIVTMDKSEIVIDDGDTFEFEGISIRFLGIDTPEISHPEYGFFEDQPYSREAAAFTTRAIEEAKTVAYIPYQEDRYGRKLAHIFVDGDLLGIRLIRAGLAYETVSHYGDNGFPKLAERILKAAKESEVKDFIEPYKWRQQHRQEPVNQEQ